MPIVANVCTFKGTLIRCLHAALKRRYFNKCGHRNRDSGAVGNPDLPSTDEGRPIDEKHGQTISRGGIQVTLADDASGARAYWTPSGPGIP